MGAATSATTGLGIVMLDHLGLRCECVEHGHGCSTRIPNSCSGPLAGPISYSTGSPAARGHPRPGGPRTVTDEQVAAVVTRTLESTPKNATHWSTRSMAKEMDISKPSMSRIWRACGLTPWAAGSSRHAARSVRPSPGSTSVVASQDGRPPREPPARSTSSRCITQPVQISPAEDDPGGIGMHPPAGPKQAKAPIPLHNRVEDLLLQTMGDQPVAELTPSGRGRGRTASTAWRSVLGSGASIRTGEKRDGTVVPSLRSSAVNGGDRPGVEGAAESVRFAQQQRAKFGSALGGEPGLHPG